MNSSVSIVYWLLQSVCAFMCIPHRAEAPWSPCHGRWLTGCRLQDLRRSAGLEELLLKTTVIIQLPQRHSDTLLNSLTKFLSLSWTWLIQLDFWSVVTCHNLKRHKLNTEELNPSTVCEVDGHNNSNYLLVSGWAAGPVTGPRESSACLVSPAAQPDVQSGRTTEDYSSPDLPSPDAAASGHYCSLRHQIEKNISYKHNQEQRLQITCAYSVFIDTWHTNIPGTEKILSSESDRGALCLFMLTLPPLSSSASIFSCRHRYII